MAVAIALDRVAHVVKKYEGQADKQFVGLLGRVKTALETSVMERVPYEQIRPYPNQPRKYFNPVSLQQMAESIDDTAQIQAGMIRRLPRSQWVLPVRYELVDGERRWRGIGMIPKERRPLYKAEIIDADDEVVQFLIAGMANFNREGHQPLETADTIDRYRKFGIPMEAVAVLLGITSGWAYNIHNLLKLPKEVKRMLEPKKQKGEPGWEQDKDRPQIPLQAAIHISKLPNPKEQVDLAHRVIRGDITIAHLRAEVVKIAEETGTEIRLREISPMKKWDSRTEKLRALTRFSSDLKRMLEEPETKRIIAAHPTEASDFLRQLGTVRENVVACESLIRQARSAR